MWLKQVKIALIEKDLEKLAELADSPPQLKEPKEIEEALFLMKEASKLAHSFKNKASLSMKKMKKNIDFLKSTQAPIRKSTLDIKS